MEYIHGRIANATVYLEPNGHSMQKPVEGLSDDAAAYIKGRGYSFRAL